MKFENSEARRSYASLGLMVLFVLVATIPTLLQAQEITG